MAEMNLRSDGKLEAIVKSLESQTAPLDETLSFLRGASDW